MSALDALAAFTLSLTAQGWALGQPVEPAALATSSGAAFMSIVFSQAANAFACRSSSRWPGALGWTSNRLLLIALPLSLALSFSLVLVPVLARALGHQPPPLVGWLLAVTSAIVLLVADAADKAWRGRRRDQPTHTRQSR